MSVPNTFASATSSIPLANLDANFAYYDAAFSISGTAVTFAGNITLTSGTANGVAYLNGSKVLTTGSALTFDGTNLGVGTATPGRRLEVRGADAVARFRGSSTQYLDVTATAGGTVNLDSNNGDFGFSINGTEQMRLTSTGLGIGTSSPSQKLTVSGAANFSRFAINSNPIDTVSTAQSCARFQSTGADFYIGTESSTAGGFFPGSTAYAAVLFNANATPMQFYTNGSIKATLDTSGNLGIGTSSPGAKLQVVDSSVNYTSPQLMVGEASVASGKQLHIGYNTTANTGYIQAVHNGTGYKDLLLQPSGGNLGLGVTPNASWANTKVFEIGDSAAPYSSVSQDIATDANLSINQNCYATSATTWFYKFSTALASRYKQAAGVHSWWNAPSGTAGAAITAFTQAMTLDASGNLLVGTTSPLISALRRGLSVLAPTGTFVAASFASDGGSSAQTVEVWNQATTGDNLFITFYTEATVTTRGSISYNRAGGLVAYNVTSDYRAKDIIGPVQNPGAMIDALKVYEGQMKGATQSRPMLIAHEAQAVTPYAVTGEKDAVNEDGTPKFQQMDVSALVPLLLAEIQSLRARVAQLESKP